ncbi:MAG: phospholipase D family protein [Rhodoferax sp.]
MRHFVKMPIVPSSRNALRTLGFGLFMLLCGCASLPPQPPLQPSSAISDYAQTPLAAITKNPIPGDTRSGFRLQPYGPNSFATRIELTRLATRSLDVQYYLMPGDNTGLTLMRAVRDAAARGVRVRVLIDDLYTAGEDNLLLALASYPNVQVRLFNPFPDGRDSDVTRFIMSGWDFSRINRRMHNKLFVADNVAAVAGGRNMADEYVMNGKGSNFVDMDVFAVGPVVRDLSAEFDHYWNSHEVFPVSDIARSSLTRVQLRQNFDRLTAGATPPEPTEVTEEGKIKAPGAGEPTSVSSELIPMMNLPFELARRHLSALLWANARVLIDPLSKTAGKNEEENSTKGTVTAGIIQWLETARSDVKMVSPYFVPTDSAVASIANARQHGINVEVVTNSLASTDEPMVYVGYSRHVKALLRMGVTILELSPSLSVKREKLGLFGHHTAGALHMKCAIVDHKQVFLGSMNIDQRSAVLNTELGLIIDSPVMARQLDNLADAATGSTYQLRLSADGQDIEWLENEGDGKTRLYHEPPETTSWQRFMFHVLSPFVPEKQL